MSALRVSWRKAAWPAGALALGVVGWEQALHAARGLETPTLPHLVLEAALAFPLALVAILIARRTAFFTAVLFTALLVPAVAAHQVIHSLLAAPQAPLHHAARAAAEPSGLLDHGLRDALSALPVALVIAFVALGARARTTRSRRPAFALLAAATIFTTLPATGAPTITPFAAPLTIPPTLTTADITLTAQQSNIQVLPGAPTSMWTFNGTFPGPTIRRPSGVATEVKVINNLPADAGELTIHHHGNHSRSIDDGQPHDVLIPTLGEHTYTYDFMEDGAPERGAFQWYHDHRMDVTGRNVWMGLAGMVILDDPAEASINAALPNGARDVPLMVTDRTFDDGNQIPYGPFTPDGKFGNVILVNGVPQPSFEVADVKYRFRLLNASNTRSYDFALMDGATVVPMTQIATESGLLPAPVERSHIMLGPAERAEVVLDFSSKLGKNLVLRNAIGFGANLSQAMQFRVSRDEAETSTVPATLRAVPAFDGGPLTTTRTWVFGRDTTNGKWTINGNGFDHARVDAQPKLGTTERWVFVNTTDADHIVHIHDVDWRIVSRSPGYPPQLDGLLGEAGLRESFRLRPDEAVTVTSRFTDHLGRYVLHCHMLEHEDFAMMAQFEVVA